jgi:hypothetical protein
MSNYLNLDIPTFIAYLDTNFFYNQPPSIDSERIVVEVFNRTSIPQRCAMFYNQIIEFYGWMVDLSLVKN